MLQKTESPKQTPYGTEKAKKPGGNGNRYKAFQTALRRMTEG